MSDNHLKVVMLAGSGTSTRMLYHALKEEFDIVNVLIENPPSKKSLLKNRAKRIGYVKTFGQILFMLFNKLLAKLSEQRYGEIKQRFHLDESDIPESIAIPIETVNSQQTIDYLQQVKPDVVVVNGTRIIHQEILDAVDVPFINTHVGITPKYRGVHGGYWALVNQDPEHCGVTVHLVDRGVDTGGILYQSLIHPTKADSFNTYPLLQLAAAIPLMKQALHDVQHHTLTPVSSDLPSMLWYHPTLLTYLIHFFTKGVR